MKFSLPKRFIPTNEKVYEPSEDTFLLLACIDVNDIKDRRVLEIGVGSGIVAYNITKYTPYAYGNDISKDAVRFANRTLKYKAKIFISKDIDAVKLEKVDVIVFNPPYLPRDNYLTDIENAFSEEECNRSVKKIIEEISKINKSITFYFVTSSLCGEMNQMIDFISNFNLKVSVVGSKKFFFEELYCFKVWK